MANWDDEDFLPAVPVPKISDKWEGEDEEDVQESWEDFGAEKKEPSSDGGEKAAAEKKKKKKLADILAEKEKKKQEELRRKKEEEEFAPPERPMTEAERIALAEERDLELAREIFGTDSEPAGVSLDAPLNSESDLKDFREKLVAKLEKRTVATSAYVTFLEDLLRDICISLDTDDVKKIGATVNAIHNEKVNAAKAGKAKKGKKGRANLNPGSRNVHEEDSAYFRGGGGYAEEYDDFI